MPEALHDPALARGRISACSEPHLTRGWAPRPGTCGYDEHRLVGPDEGAPGALRLLVVGDSVAAQDLWIRALADHLAELGGQPVAAWNAGVEGYHPCQTDQALAEALPVVAPDFVLVQLCHNDLHGTGTLVPLGEGRVRYFVGEQAMDLPAWTFRSRLLTLGSLVAGSRLVARTTGRAAEEALDATARCLRATARRLQEADVPGAVALFPVLRSDADAGAGLGRAREEEETLRTLLGSVELPLVDLRPTLEAHAAETTFAAPPTDLVHPSKEGQRVFGEALAEGVARELRLGAWPPDEVEGSP